MIRFQHLKFKRIIITAVSAFIVIILLITLIILGYATFLGFQARGAPDQQKITLFVAENIEWITMICCGVISFAAAFMLSNKVEARKTTHGLLMGLIVVFLLLGNDIFFSSLSWHIVINALIILAVSRTGARFFHS